MSLLSFSLVVYVSVILNNQGRDATQEFEKAIQGYPNVIECSFMTGSYDYLIKTVARDITDYETFLMNRLTKLPCIAKVESFVSMRTVKSSVIIPV
ncbi:Leucine-responsive regulatory protein [Ruegeria denitrificans]|uniref:Leucine-responsive regulatory protein n=1 Tax=Ruegeria denitrificans TaxID=1715692 RepID=A0A0N7MAY1_9RHOB|nr:Lrp/AsnC ligand binding domain-containing protein [Ruegeria denitrificans]CUK18251.1 Leucine-responsive regulatory protein [Ruegeria denitrificans]